MESIGDRAKKKGRFGHKEVLVHDEVRYLGVEGVEKRVVRTQIALGRTSTYEPSSEENPFVPNEVFDSRRILGLAAYSAAMLDRFTGSK